jgi:diacylglycerol kinase family enzyme
VKFAHVRVFVNRRSGSGWSFDAVEEAFEEHWSGIAESITYQFPATREQTIDWTHRALAEGVDCVAVAGGDGTVSSVGVELIGSSACLAVIPVGSGNGLARHFSQSMRPAESVAQLARGRIYGMDVGLVDGRPFLVSCSMAWDAALVQTYNRSPVRGVWSYVFAGVYEFFEYRPQPMHVTVDEAEEIELERPILFTVGNLSGWGGGALIADDARGDDGLLELAAAHQRDAPVLFANLAEVFEGGLKDVPRVIFRRFKRLRIRRSDPHPIQLDGELVEAGRDVEVAVRHNALRVLVPAEGELVP